MVKNEGRSGRQHEPAWVDDFLPSVLPFPWRLLEDREDGSAYGKMLLSKSSMQTVIVSGATELDGRRWLHVSTARPDRLPSWEELMEVKEIFIGLDRKAIQVLPARQEHVNIHPGCLHLFYCLDGDTLPDFTHGSASL